MEPDILRMEHPYVNAFRMTTYATGAHLSLVGKVDSVKQDSFVLKTTDGKRQLIILNFKKRYNILLYLC